MDQVISVPFTEGGAILIEVAPDGREVPFSSRTERGVAKSTQTLQAVIAPVRQVARAFYDELVDLPDKPQAVKVKFGVQLDVDGHAVIARVGVGMNFEITLEWSASEPDPAPAENSSILAATSSWLILKSRTMVA